MNVAGGIVVYLLVWWMVLFTMLPQGVVADEDALEDPSLASGSPKDPKLSHKFKKTTLIAALVWIVIYFVLEWAPIDLYDIAQNMSEEDKVK